MLNHSLAQLRQVALANIDLPTIADGPPTQGASPAVHFTTPIKAQPAWASLEGGLDEAPESPTKRPSAIRRRSTRTKAVHEPAPSRSGRHEEAICRHSHESFFVIEAADEKAYVSEIQPGLSPAFLPFKLDARVRTMELACYTRRAVRLASQDKAASWQLLLRLKIDLDALVSIGSKPETRDENALLLQFAGAAEDWYTPLDKTVQPPQGYVAPKAVSHSFNQLMRLQMLTEVINDAWQAIHTMRDRVEVLLAEEAEHRETLCKVESIQHRLEDYRVTTARLRKKCVSDEHRVSFLRERNKRRAALLAADGSIPGLTERIGTLHAQTVSQTAQLLLIASEKRRVQRVLTTDLASIYPLCTTASQHTIRNLNLARQSVFSASYSAEEAAALGYTAHLIVLLARYLAVPLRYPLRLMGSSSFILDPISLFPDSSDPDERGAGPPYSMRKDRRYPLFYSKADMPRFNYGVFLLNKNVEQLMQARGLVCGELRDTLINLGVLVFWTTSITEDEDIALSSPARRRRLSNATAPRSRLSRIDSAVEEVVEEQADADDEIVNHDDVLRARSKVKVQELISGDQHRSVREKKCNALSSPVGSLSSP